MRAVSHLLLLFTTVLTCRGSGCSSVGVAILSPCRLTCPLSMSTVRSLLGSQARVVRVLLHEQSTAGDSLCLNASVGAEDERGGERR